MRATTAWRESLDRAELGGGDFDVAHVPFLLAAEPVLHPAHQPHHRPQQHQIEQPCMGEELYVTERAMSAE